MIYLRQSTASQEILLGPFVDSTDGDTEETGLTIANTDIKIWKAGATTLANKNSGGATHIANGMYYAVLDATDTDTIGSGRVYVHVSGALAAMTPFTVLDEAVFDVVFGTAAPSTLAAGALMGLADDAITAAKLAADAGTEIGSAVWASTTRVLTAGTNIALAKGSGVTGFNDVSSADVNAACDTAISDAALAMAAAVAAIPSTAKKNTALANFAFFMTDSVNHQAATGQTVTCTRSIDGGAFGAGSLANVAEIGDGIYNVDFLAADLNGDVIVLRAAATGCDDTFVTLVTAK